MPILATHTVSGMHTADFICVLPGKDTELPTSPSWVLQPSYPGHLPSIAPALPLSPRMLQLGWEGPLPASQAPSPRAACALRSHTHPPRASHTAQAGRPACSSAPPAAPGGSQNTTPVSEPPCRARPCRAAIAGRAAHLGGRQVRPAHTGPGGGRRPQTCTPARRQLPSFIGGGGGGAQHSGGPEGLRSTRG